MLPWPPGRSYSYYCPPDPQEQIHQLTNKLQKSQVLRLVDSKSLKHIQYDVFSLSSSLPLSLSLLLSLSPSLSPCPLPSLSPSLSLPFSLSLSLSPFLSLPPSFPLISLRTPLWLGTRRDWKFNWRKRERKWNSWRQPLQKRRLRYNDVVTYYSYSHKGL